MAQPYQRPGSAFAGPQQVQYNAPGSAQGQNTPPPGHYQQPSGGPPPSMMNQSQQQNPPPPSSQWSQAPPPQPGWQQGHTSSVPQSQPPPMSNYNPTAYGAIPGTNQAPAPSAPQQSNSIGPGSIRPPDNAPNPSQGGWQQPPPQAPYGNQQQQYQQPQQQQYSQGSQNPQAPPQAPQQQQQQHTNQQQPPQRMEQAPYLQQQPLQQSQPQPQPQSQQQNYFRPPNPAYSTPNQPSQGNMQASGPSQPRPPSVPHASPAQSQTLFQPPGQSQTPQQQISPYNIPPPPQQGTSFGQQAPMQHQYGQSSPVTSQYPQGGSANPGPPPPPLPADYQPPASSIQPGAIPHPQYSHQPLTHQYDPQSQNQASSSQPPPSQRMSSSQASGPYSQNAPPAQIQYGQPAPNQAQHPQQIQNIAPQYNAPQLQSMNQGPPSQTPQQLQQQMAPPNQQLQGQPQGQYGPAPPMPLSSPPPQQPSPWQAAPPPPPLPQQQTYQGNNSSPQTGQFPPGPSSIDTRPPVAQQYQQPQPERKRFTYIPPGNKPGTQQIQGGLGSPAASASQDFNQQPQMQQTPGWSGQNQQPQAQPQRQTPVPISQWQPTPTAPQTFPPLQNQNALPSQSNLPQSQQNYQQPQPGSNIGNWQGQGGVVNQPGQGQNQGWDHRQSHNGTSTDLAEYQHIRQDSGEHPPPNGAGPVQDAQVASHQTSHETHRPDFAVQPVSGPTATKSPQVPSQAQSAPQAVSQELDKKKETEKVVSPPMSPSVLGPSALGGANGPSDWEHFAAFDSDEDIDDTETFGAKDEMVKPVSNNALNVTAELPSGPSPPPHSVLQRHSSSRISSEPDVWPTLPMPAPLQPNRPLSQAESIGRVATPPLSHVHYTPTPPPKNDQPWGSPGRAASVISFDAPSAPSSRPTNSGVNIQQPQPVSQHSYTARDSFLNDDVISHKSFNISDTNVSHAVHGENSGSGFGVVPEQHSVAVQPTPVMSGQRSDDLSADKSVSPRQSQTTVPANLQQPAQIASMPVQTAVVRAVLMDRSTQTEVEEPPSQDTKAPNDPYAHLDPWHRDCLSRFANTLQQEAAAVSDQDRKKAFIDFMTAESKLRDIPYSSSAIPPVQDRQQHTENAIVTAPKSLVSTSPQPMETATKRAVDDDSEYSPGGRPRNRTSSIVPDQVAHAVQSSIKNAPNRALSYRKPIKAYSIPVGGVSKTLPQSIPESPANNAPVLVDERSMVRSNTGADVPIRPEIQHASSSDSQTYKAYTPPTASESASKQDLDFPNFKDSEKKEEEFPDFINESSRRTSVPVVSQPPSKTAGSSTRTGGKVRSMTAHDEHGETFIDPPSQEKTIESKASNHAIKSLQPPTKKMEDDASAVEPDNDHTTDQTQEDAVDDIARDGKHDKLHTPDTEDSVSRKTFPTSQPTLPSVDFPSILPLRNQEQSKFAKPTKNIEESLSALPGDSTFAKKAVEAWETRSKTLRDRREKERQIRQEEQEEQTDRLFSENQIGYSDISELEEEFKRSERDRKSQEEKEEYDSFVREVFEPIYNQLQEDIKLLKSHEAQCFDLMKSAVAGKNASDTSNSNARLVDCMKIFLDLHSQIEFRHAKVLEAIQDRNKRYKRTVVQPLYASGNITRMKQMEKHFDESEKKAALDASREKLARAKRLMETVEQGTMRGVGENLDYMEEITQAIQQLAKTVSSLKDDRYRGQPHVAYQDVLFAESIVQQLTECSHTLMRSFHAAAQAVNFATYDVAVLSAKLANADGAELDRIRKEKDDEEARLAEDLKHRLSVVSSDLEAANEQGRNLLPELKKLKPAIVPETMIVPPTRIMSGPPGDIEHQQRIQKALEAAKKRNAGMP